MKINHEDTKSTKVFSVFLRFLENQPRRYEEHEGFFCFSSFPSFLRGCFSEEE